jgi:hypothetical protein
MTRAGGWLASVALSGAAGLAAPAVASSDIVYCVPTASIAGCPAGSTGEATITAAMHAVNTDPAATHDTIRIGPGTYSEGSIDDQSNQVGVIGAGESATTIDPPSGNNAYTLILANQSSSVQGLTLDVAPGAHNIGLISFGAASSVAIVAGVGSTNATGAEITHSGTFAEGSVSVPDPGTGILTSLGTTTVTGSVITAGIGVLGSANVAGTRIDANRDLELFSTGFGVLHLTVDDSLLLTKPGSESETAVDAEPGGLVGSIQFTVLARHDTMIGDGSTGSRGIACVAVAGFNAPASCSVSLDSAIVEGFSHALVRGAVAGSMPGDDATATIGIDYSDVDPSTDQDQGNTGGGFLQGTPSGQITLGAHDVNVPGGFAGGSGVDAYALTRQSMLIDAGDPVLGSGEPTADLAGAPRVVAGRAAAGAVSDIGAFEYQDRPPTVTASASPVVVATGRPLRFNAVASVSDPGDAVTGVVWRFSGGGGGRASGASVSHVFSRAGPVRAVATVTDLNGYSVASAPVTVTVVGKPSIKGLRVKPRSFRAGRGGGAIVRLRVSVAARCAFVIQRRIGKRFVHARSFTRACGPGAVSFHFPGRSLKPGQYRLSVIAGDAAGPSKPVLAAFTVVA